MVKQKIEFISSDEGALDKIKLLWQDLNNHHHQNSTHFKEFYRNMTFEKRKADLLEKAAVGSMQIDIAIDKATEQAVGYVVSIVNSKKTGEIESIFVSNSYRGMHIGDKLVKRALKWMEQKGADAKIVEVGEGNEQAFGFYSKYGFLPRKTVLKQIKKD